MKIRFDRFELDSDTRQLLREGEEVHLSPKAFAVLSALLAKRPNVVPKAELFGQIWPDVFVVDANLNVLVGEVRRAIDDDPQLQRFIRTVHGVGYAFCGQAMESTRDLIHEAGPQRFWLAWKNQTYALGAGDNLIGRDPACQVWVDHAGVSRRHARIHIAKDTERPVLTDLESTNGTFVDGKRIATATALTDGAVIKIGSVSLKFRAWTEQAARTKRIRGSRSGDRAKNETETA